MRLRILLCVFILPTFLILSGCKGSKDDNGNPPAGNSTNYPPVLTIGDDQSVSEGQSVSLTSSSVDVDGSVVSYSWIQLSGQSVSISDENTAIASFFAPDVIVEESLVFSLSVLDDSGNMVSESTTIIVKPIFLTSINDTGVTLCGDYAFDNSLTHNNDVNCDLTDDSSESKGGDPVPFTQDGQFGRDKTDNDDRDGHAGFSFTKLGPNGVELLADSTEWGCVRDNVTELIWEHKQVDSGLRDKSWTYTWYTTLANHGGYQGIADGGDDCYDSSRCDTDKYTADVNSSSLCGLTDWRLPSLAELLSIVDYSSVNLAIDSAYFDVTNGSYWSSGTDASSNQSASYVSFYFGKNDIGLKNNLKSVILVSDAN